MPAKPFLVMYGYTDPADVRYGGFWPTREQWEAGWKPVLERFNIITGRTRDAEMVKKLRTQGKLFAYHVLNTIDEKHQTADDFVAEWSKPFEDTLGGQLAGGFDAISIDELHSYPDGSKESETTIAALRELRRRYPHKRIIAWSVWKVALGGSTGYYGNRYVKDKLFDRQLQAAAECCDLLILECYQREGNPQFNLFTEMARNVQARMPGLLSKTVFGLGISQSKEHNYDDRDDVDFGEFLERQFKLLRSDATLSQTPGVAFWAFYRAKPETVQKLCEMTQRCFPTPKP